MAPSRSSKFLDVSTSQSIGRDVCAIQPSQSVGGSMAIVTHNDFDCAGEMNFLTKKSKLKEQKKNEKNI